MNQMSARSLLRFGATFRPRESSNFLKYYLFNSVSAGGEQSDEECKTGQFCGMTEIDFDRYDVRLQGLSGSTASSTSSVTPLNSISVPSGSSSVKFCFSVTPFWLLLSEFCSHKYSLLNEESKITGVLASFFE